MSSPLPLFPTTVIGSMPRPQYIKDLLASGSRKKALEHVSAERLTLNPDWGFAPGKDHAVPLEEAYLKLKNLGEAGRRLRR